MVGDFGSEMKQVSKQGSNSTAGRHSGVETHLCSDNGVKPTTESDILQFSFLTGNSNEFFQRSSHVSHPKHLRTKVHYRRKLPNV